MQPTAAVSGFIQIASRARSVAARAHAGLTWKAPAMRNHINIDSVHSQAIASEIGIRLRASLKPELELPANLGAQIDRLCKLEELSPSTVSDEAHWTNPRH
jgi:hypothetical protein